MGLDMYLTAERYIGGWRHEGDEERDLYSKALALVGLKEPICDGAPSATLEINFGYWRKANAIHRWFVEKVQDGVDDCAYYDVERDQLRELAAECQRVLVEPEVAAKVLPTQSGFFFGPTDHDEYYLDDLKNTVEIIERALKLPNSFSFRYRASW